MERFLRLAACFVLIVIFGHSSLAFGQARPSAAGPTGISENQQVQSVQQGPCRAALPTAWQLTPGQNGQTADVSGPQGAYASWGIVAVNPAMQRFYGNLYGPPEVHVSAMLLLLLHAPAQLMPAENVGGFYTLHRFSTGRQQGVLLYHVYPAPMGQYIISEYFSWGPSQDQRLVSQAEAVMTSLQCTSSVRPPAGGEYTYHAPDNSSRRRSGGSAEGDSLKDYNSQLGTQYAHDSAGNNYLLDRATQWDDNGTDGPGYYKGSGVNRQKLTPGLE